MRGDESAQQFFHYRLTFLGNKDLLSAFGYHPVDKCYRQRVLGDLQYRGTLGYTCLLHVVVRNATGYDSTFGIRATGIGIVAALLTQADELRLLREQVGIVAFGKRRQQDEVLWCSEADCDCSAAAERRWSPP